MTRRLGRFAIWAAVIVAGSAAILVLCLLLGAPLILAAAVLAALYGAVAMAWVTEFMYRKAFPNQFRKFEKQPQNRTLADDRDE
jgi:hypothetical protein